MQFLVRLTARAAANLEAIYDFREADAIEAAFTWFNELSETIYSLEQLPERRGVLPDNKKLRELLFGGGSNTYRIIYMVERRTRVVKILHIRHGARTGTLED